MTIFYNKNFWLAVILTIFVALACSFLAKAQETPQSWLIWQYHNSSVSYPLAQVYKIQDGSCSIYVALGYPGNTAPVAIATGQGCK